jgi:hypothetical protein
VALVIAYLSWHVLHLFITSQDAPAPIRLLQLVDSNTSEDRVKVRSSFDQWKSRPPLPPVESRIDKTRYVVTANSERRCDQLDDHIAAFVRGIVLKIADRVVADKDDDDQDADDAARNTLANVDRVENYIRALKQVSVALCFPGFCIGFFLELYEVDFATGNDDSICRDATASFQLSQKYMYRKPFTSEAVLTCELLEFDGLKHSVALYFGLLVDSFVANCKRSRVFC